MTFPLDGQGIYESCDPHGAGCAERLRALARAGFQLVINYGQFSPDATLFDEVMYAVRADQEGMRVIWPVNALPYHPNSDHALAAAYPTLDQSMRASGLCPDYAGTNYGFVACFTRAVRGLSGTWGYYIGDELPASREPELRRLVDAVYDVDPDHPRLYVAGGVGDAINRGDLTAFGRSYCDGYQCHPDATVLAQDFYPVGTGMQEQAATLTGAVAAGVQSVATRNGAAYGMVLQAHSLAQYREIYPWCSSVAACPYPTQGQMLAMRDAVLAHPRPRLLLWYSAFDVQRSENAAQRWADLRAAVNQGKPAPPKPTATPTIFPTPPTPLPIGSVSARPTGVLTPATGDLRLDGEMLLVIALAIPLLALVIAGGRAWGRSRRQRGLAQATHETQP